ncbi:MAG: hypothetical protein AB1696_04445 [Planctomycetota bacterium]
MRKNSVMDDGVFMHELAAEAVPFARLLHAYTSRQLPSRRAGFLFFPGWVWAKTGEGKAIATLDVKGSQI